MKLNKTVIFSLSSAILLSACQSDRSDISNVDDILSGLDKNEGIVLLSHRLDDLPCQAILDVTGTTKDGKTVEEKLFNHSGIRLAPEKYLLATLPAGQYQIKKITCVQNYQVGGFGTLARFKVEEGKAHNLNVLDMTKVKSERNLGRSFRIKRDVRPFKESELTGFKAKYPEISARLIDTPMQVKPTAEEIQKTLDLLKKIIEKRQETAVDSTPEIPAAPATPEPQT